MIITSKRLYLQQLKDNEEQIHVEHKLFRDYIKAREQWLNTMCQPGMVHIINKQSKWFKDIEAEKKDVLFFKDWKIKRFRRIKKVRNDNQDKNILGNRKKGKDDVLKYKELYYQSTTDSLNWLIRRHDVLSGLRALGLKNRILNTFLFLLILCSIILLTNCAFNYYSAKIRLENLKSLDLLIVPFSIIATLYIYYCIGWIRNVKIPGIFIPRTIMAVSSARFAVILATELWLLNIDVKFEEVWWKYIVLIVIMVFFMKVELSRITGRSRRGHYFQIFVVLGLAMTYSLFIGTMYSSHVGKKLLIRTETAYKYYEDQMIHTPPVDSLYHCSAMIYDNHEEHFEKLEKEGLYEHYCIKLENNFWLKRQLANVIGDDHLDFYIFPGLILVNAIMSVFVGLFLQLIFDERAITESL